MARDNSNPAIGIVLRELRVQRGMTQEELAAKAKMHRNYIGGLERGEKSPTIKSVGRLIAVLGVSWTELGSALDAQA
ncbi:MAG TPA: helix-turn-helix transcriptional regulator [Longimicrobium sp.]|jgi:transcriptional regulator with XRE-family HTH domain|uniref:helix-turn-helix domain-containing protein n=1 Tax=Longimicrobium sp. TaxID=2029185 RepID=UPI002ED8C676